jgi:aldose 1-epimerase
MSGPNGEQLEITRGTARAVITSVGANLRAYTVDGVPYVETFGDDETPPLGCGAVLVPWPNRVAGARWHHDGEQLDLAVTEPARGHAIHGLVRHEPWTVADRADGSVTLTIDVGEQPGWPFPFRTNISYELGYGELVVTHGVQNTGERDMPFGVGTHPYPRPGNADVDTCELVLAADAVVPVDAASLIPTGDPLPVADTELDFRGGRPIRDVELDTAFRCLPAEQGVVRHEIRTADGGGVRLWADENFPWVQVFTAAEFPGKGARAVAVEPMTCPPDALNSGVGLLTLAPGETWLGRWGITPLRG